MKFAMTGATGFLGGALAHQLLAAGHTVTVVVRSPDKAETLRAEGAHVVAGDVGDVASMTRAFTGVDGVFHVAGWYKVGDAHPEEAWRVNVAGTRNTLVAVREAGVPRVVYTSTLAVNSDTHGEVRDETYRFTGRHLTVYDETKALAHEAAVRFAAEPDGPEVVIVMPGGIYGPGDTSQIGTWMAQVAHGERVLASARLRMMQAHVDDVAAGHVAAMERGRAGQSYMLAGERSDLAAMLQEVAVITGGRPPIVMPGPLLPVTERFLRMAERILPLPAELHAESLRSAQASYLGTPAKAQRELGWRFRPLPEGLRETAVAEGWISE